MLKNSGLQDYLGLKPEVVSRVLEFLVDNGLISYDKGKYSMGQTNIHLGKDSTNIHKHHSNWRTRSLQSLDNLQDTNDLHYTVAGSMSRTTALELKERFIQLIQENLKTISTSKEEVLYCNTIDFFEVKN